MSDHSITFQSCLKLESRSIQYIRVSRFQSIEQLPYEIWFRKTKFKSVARLPSKKLDWFDWDFPIRAIPNNRKQAGDWCLECQQSSTKLGINHIGPSQSIDMNFLIWFGAHMIGRNWTRAIGTSSWTRIGLFHLWIKPNRFRRDWWSVDILPCAAAFYHGVYNPCFKKKSINFGNASDNQSVCW